MCESRLQELPAATTRLLGSSQVITSVFSVVKELVENAFDAGANTVDVKLDNYGIDKIEVRDNGDGIPTVDVPCVTKRFHTSKISAFSDLEHLSTYGFRGEALGSLCSLSNLSITTRTSKDDISLTYMFNKQGQITSSKPSHLGQGTTITAVDLFSNVPVRRQYYNNSKKKKEELKKVEELLYSYGIIRPDVRISLRHNKELVWQKNPVPDIKTSLSTVLGRNVVSNLHHETVDKSEPQMEIELYIPRLDGDLQHTGRSGPDRCFTFINKRPIKLKELEKLIRQYYISRYPSESLRYPVFCVSIILPPAELDVNVDPNKTTIFLHHKEIVLDLIGDILEKNYGSRQISKIENKDDLNLNHQKLNGVDCDKTPKPVPQEELSSDVHVNSDDAVVKVRHDISCSTLSSDIPTFRVSSLENAKTLSDKEVFQSSKSSLLQMEDKICQQKDSLIDSSTEKCVEMMPVNVSKKDILVSSSGYVSENEMLAPPADDVSNKDLLAQSGGEILKTCSSAPSGDNISKKCFNAPSCDSDKADSGIDTDDQTIPVSQQPYFEIGENLFSDIVVENNVIDQGSKNQQVVCTTGADDTFSDLLSTWQNEDTTKTKNIESNIPSNDSCTENHASKLPNGNMEQSSTDKGNEYKILPSALDIWSKGQVIVGSSGEIIQPVALLNTGKRPLSSPADSPPAKKRQVSQEMVDQPKLFDMISNKPVKSSDTGFTTFSKECRHKVVKENPKSDYSEITEILETTWNDLPDIEKDKYKSIISPKQQKQKVTSVKSSRQLSNKMKDKLAQPGMSIKDHLMATTKKSPVNIPTKSVMFSLEELKQIYSSQLYYSQSQVSSKNSLIGQLRSCGLWCLSSGSEIQILNHHRVQETILYHKLMSDHVLPIQQLENPIVLNESNTGGLELWNVLVTMATEANSCDTYGYILDDRLIGNGIKVKYHIDKENTNMTAELVAINSTIPMYGLSDLMEILELISKTQADTLSKTRPLKVINYLQGEAVRMARQLPRQQTREDIEDLLEQIHTELPRDCHTCLHNKTFYHTVYDLNDMPLTQTQE